MKHLTLLSIGIGLLSGCVAVGNWKGARDYRKSQIENKTVWGGYGWGYMEGWNMQKTINNLNVLSGEIKKFIDKDEEVLK